MPKWHLSIFFLFLNCAKPQAMAEEFLDNVVMPQLQLQVMTVPEEPSSYPNPVPNPSEGNKTVLIDWSVLVKTEGPHVEIETLSVIAFGASGSKRLAYAAYAPNEHISSYTNGGAIPVRCFAQDNAPVRLETEVTLRQIADDGSVARDPRPRKFIDLQQPPYIAPYERYRGSTSRLCSNW